MKDSGAIRSGRISHYGKKDGYGVDRLIQYIAVVLLGWIVIAVFLLGDGTEYVCKKKFLVSNRLILLLILGIAGIWEIGRRSAISGNKWAFRMPVPQKGSSIADEGKLIGGKEKKKGPNKYAREFRLGWNATDLLVLLVGMVMLGVQFCICRSIFFEAGWDPGTYIMPAALVVVAIVLYEAGIGIFSIKGSSKVPAASVGYCCSVCFVDHGNREGIAAHLQRRGLCIR